MIYMCHQKSRCSKDCSSGLNTIGPIERMICIRWWNVLDSRSVLFRLVFSFESDDGSIAEFSYSHIVYLLFKFLLDKVSSLCCETVEECHLLLDALKWHQMPQKRSTIPLMNSNSRIENKHVLVFGGFNFPQKVFFSLYTF